MKKTKDNKEEYVTKAELARRLTVSASMVSKYLKKGLDRFERQDGKLPWLAAQKCVGDNVIAAMSGSFHFRQQCKERATAGMGLERLRVSKELTSATAQADFFRVCRDRFGLSARQAYGVVAWHNLLTIIAEDVVDVAGEPDWAALIGPSDDLGKVEEWYDTVTMPELTAGIKG